MVLEEMADEKHDLVTPPETMDWLIDAIKAKGDKLFKLDDEFMTNFKDAEPPFGFNGLGQLVYARTYSRIKPDGTNEKWVDTIQRVVEGVFEVQKVYCTEVLKTSWDETKAQTAAQDMFDRMFHMKFLPPGRGLWAMGTSIVRDKGLGAALNNCAFVSTEDVTKDPARPFVFLMDASMLGVGVGFDTEGAGKLMVHQPKEPKATHVVGDTREGWVESLRVLLNSYFVEGSSKTEFDYSQIRPAGLPLKTFGGFSSGADPLKDMHERICGVLEKNVGSTMTVTTIVDIMNLIGKCVVAGNVRRTAEIAFGNANCEEFLNLKNYEANPHRAEYGWTSNNSVFAEVGMDYVLASENIQKNGEPGFAWLDNMQSFSRMRGRPDHRDHKVKGGNPCLEQSLESMELCCLVETFPNHHEDLEDFKKTLDMAILYAKTVTLITVHWPATREVMYRNRRIGCSVSGIAQFITSKGLHTLQKWLEAGYFHLFQEDRKISKFFKVPNSVKLTSVKPSGTISLLCGATPGVHYPESRFYIRRVRMAKNFPMLQKLKEAGYTVEPAVGSEESTVVVEVPVDVGNGIRGVAEVSMWEQLCLAAFMQRHWADNQVSATVTFDPEKEGPQIAHALQYFQYQLKGISFLPRHDFGAFPQMPYEAIDEEKYKKELAHITALPFADTDGLPPRTRSTIQDQEDTTHKMEDAFCDGDKCIMPTRK
jgi:adenosylcobalamin-dependent ribonucleoside-triphosphate reductase